MPVDPELLAQWDRDHLWHPFTQMRDWAAAEPIIIERGEGSFLIDVKGRRYLDGVASMWTLVHGHRKKELDEALVAQTAKIAHSTLLGLSAEQPVILARRLAAIMPRSESDARRLTRVFYSDDGSTAVEVAIKMALQFHAHEGNPRTRFVKLTGAYHGDTLGAVAMGGVEIFLSAFKPLLFDALTAPAPYPLHPPCGRADCEAGCIDGLSAIFEKHGAQIAALVVEPIVQGAGGFRMHGPAYLRAARRLCDQHGALLIADEIATGFGRTGPMWACDRAGIVPDILCTAKGLTAGYLPLAATVATDRVYQAFLGPYEALKTFFHGHTFTGNALASAVAIANLDLYESEKVIARSEATIAHLQARLAGVAAHPHVIEVRQSGFMVGIELAPSKDPAAPGYPWESRVGVRACLAARDKGVFLRPLGNVVVLNPPLSITRDEIELLVSAALHGIEVATNG